MPQAHTMTLEEEAVIALKAFELKKQGNFEEYERTRKQIPLTALPCQICQRAFWS